MKLNFKTIENSERECGRIPGYKYNELQNDGALIQ